MAMSRGTAEGEDVVAAAVEEPTSAFFGLGVIFKLTKGARSFIFASK
jgi:hypothetical protein